jgi:hypothetical protein
MNTTIKWRLSIAGAAAVIALTSASFAVTATAADKTQPVHCYGINTCKGTSACATAKSECKGHNSCKGTGFVQKTEAECLKAGGTLTETK